ncbi:hypothetical protein PIB30_085415, partial [Stylosanthes scabra]|nr:hypothetical protein [Stylosanthes scabra]
RSNVVENKQKGERSDGKERTKNMMMAGALTVVVGCGDVAEVEVTAMESEVAQWLAVAVCREKNGGGSLGNNGA